MKKLILSLVLFAGCGQQEAPDDTNTKQSNPVEVLQRQIDDLRLTQTALNAVVNSDFKDCTGSASYATDKLTNRICQIAQASEAETREEMRGQIEHYAKSLESEINAIDTQVAELQTQVDALPDQAELDALADDIADIQADISDLQSDVSTLQGEMTSAQNAITALQNLTNSLNSAIANAFGPVEIGTELLSAGPLYESVLRTTDKLLIHSFVIAESVGVTISNNGADPTNGSPTVVITATSHGFLTGDLVRIEGLSGTGNITRADVAGEFVVNVINANTFEIDLSHNSNTGSTFGGSAGIATKVIARGMSRIWQSTDASDSAVRVAIGSRPYNFIIKKGLTGAGNANQGYVCYSTLNRQATFATINAATAVGLNSGIQCK